MRWWEPKLSPLQERSINNILKEPSGIHRVQGPSWIQGYAGTGKTLVLAHVAERIIHTSSAHPRPSMSYVTYTHALKDMVSTGYFSSATKRQLRFNTAKQFIYERNRFDYVLLDECQDISLADIVKIKQLASHLIMAGDPGQQIYDHGSTKEEIDAKLATHPVQLTEVFRLTPKLKDFADSIFPEAGVVGGDPQISRNTDIRVLEATSDDEEARWVVREAVDRALPLDPGAILFPTHRDISHFASNVARSKGIPQPPSKADGYDQFNRFWESHEIPIMYLGNKFGDLKLSDKKPMVYIMTYHSAKGLDFENVFLPGMTPKIRLGGPEATERKVRRLLFVAVTRSRRDLFVTYSGGRLHPYIDAASTSNVTTRGSISEHDEDDDDDQLF